MTDLDKHVDTFARGVVILEMSMIPVMVMRDFGVTRGWVFGCESGRSITDFARAFMKRFPIWREGPHGKGLELNPDASAHAKMSWAAFVRECRVEAGVAS